MSTSRVTESRLTQKTALIVGLGGLGCPAALALVRAGVGTLLLCDDDTVDATNLHRQILFSEKDVGRDKLDAARDALSREGASEIELIRSRFLPENSRALVRRADIVLEGADNFATKFLAADTCFLEEKPIVHGACIRFVGTAWSVSPTGQPCYRCLFEDLLPEEQSPNCNSAGVFGPVVGVIGALMADLAFDALLDVTDRSGQVFSFDGKRLVARTTVVSPRTDCPLCGSSDNARENDPSGSTTRRITDVSRRLYTHSGPLEARLNEGSTTSSTTSNG